MEKYFFDVRYSQENDTIFLSLSLSLSFSPLLKITFSLKETSRCNKCQDRN